MGFRIPKSWQILKRFSREPLHIKIFEECHKKFESDFFLAHIPTDDDYNEWINIDGIIQINLMHPLLEYRIKIR